MTSAQRLPLIALALAVIFVFLRTLSFDWVQYDDPKHIFENARILNPSFASLASFWKAPFFGLYVPVTYTSWGVVAWFAGRRVDAADFHLFNLALHLINTFLVVRLLSICLPGKSVPRNSRLWDFSSTPLAAYFGAALFALHPLQVETVAWISCGKDLLSTSLGLSALWLHMTAPAPTRRKGVRTLCFVLALLAKPSAVAFIALAFALDVFMQRQNTRASIKSLIPATGAAIIIFVLTALEQPAEKIGFVAPLWARPLLALDAVLFYAQKLVWPGYFSVDYARTSLEVMASGWLLLRAGLALGLVILLWWQRKLFPQLLQGACLFVLPLLPVLGLIPFSFQKNSNVADRYAYAALFGVAYSYAFLFVRFKTPAQRILLSLPLIVCTAISQIQLEVWKSSEPLFKNALAKAPQSLVSHVNLAYDYHTRGIYPLAAKHFRTATELDPKTPELQVNLGAALSAAGSYTDAAISFEKALALDPQNFNAYYNYGLLAAKQGNSPMALRYLTLADKLRPGIPQVQRALAEITPRPTAP